MNDLSQLPILSRRIGDVNAVVARLDTNVRRVLDGTDRIERPAGLIARLAAANVLARTSRQSLDGLVRQNWKGDRDLASLIELRAAVAPAQTNVSGWAAELVGIAVQDIADNLLPASVLTSLRAFSGASYLFVNGGIVRAPSAARSANAKFVADAGAIPMVQFLLSSLSLPPKKCASIVAFTKELASGSLVNVEIALQSLLRDDLTLSVDGILLDANAADSVRPPGLLNTLTPLTPSATGTITDKIASDTKALLGAIAPAMRPMLIVSTAESAVLDAVGSLLPKITTPVLAAGSVVAIDAAAFASALGTIEFNVSEESLVHEETAPGPISAAGTPNTVAAPTRSLWQTASIGLRSLLDANWGLRRSGAVAVMNGVGW